MKNITFLTILIVLSALSASSVQACDICGCGAGSYYIGILPEFNSKIVGVRHRSSALTTHLSPTGSRTYLTTDERYHTTELWGGWTIKDRFRVMAYFPVSTNTKMNSVAGRESRTGISDASLMGFYRLLRNKKTLSGEGSYRLLVQDLWVGGGVKLPTGKYDPGSKSTTTAGTNLFQLGTGSTDIILMGMYDARLQDIGLNVTASYKINTPNAYNYYYGNRTSASMQVYYKVRFNNKWMVAPSLGYHFEQSASDLDDGYTVRPTGGTAGFATLGAEVTFEKCSIGGNYQPVIHQALGYGAVASGNRFMLHFSWIF